MFEYFSDLITVDDAIAIIKSRLVNTNVGCEWVPLDDAVGRILAQDIYSKRPNPISDNSAVDGYAFAFDSVDQANDFTEINILTEEEHKAGASSFAKSVPLGFGVRIFTGGIMPLDADTVIPQELVTVDQKGVIRFSSSKIKKGSNCRLKGEDFCQGQLLISEGTLFTPRHLSLVVSSGISGAICVKNLLKVAIFSSGDELMSPYEECHNRSDSRIFDANGAMLKAMIKGFGAIPLFCSIIKDTNECVKSCLSKASSCGVDCIITSGGVSVGDYDCIIDVLRKEGSVEISGVAMKPGRPFSFGYWQGIPVFCLPGNPVACFVTYILFVYGALMALSGAGFKKVNTYNVICGFPAKKKLKRREFVRVYLGEDQIAKKISQEGSGIITGLCNTHGLLDLQEGLDGLQCGDVARFIPYPDV